MPLSCNLSSRAILQNATLAALTCSSNIDPENCTALCPNADITGVGVRIAFYVQSLLNTLLVIFSRRDSVPTTWAATLLTGALVIAAMVQKRNQSITLHHSLLVLNFATLSCISSLAVAPTLSIWRLTPRQYYAKRLAQDMLDGDQSDADDRLIGKATEIITDRRERKIARAQNKQRTILALALLTQVVLQWAWGIILFVSPVYSQTSCSGNTALVLFFLWTTTAEKVNGNMVGWVFWLLFSLGLTMVMTVILAVSSPARARSGTRFASPASSMGATSLSTASTPRPRIYRQLLASAVGMVPSWKDRSAQLIFWYNMSCLVLWTMYIVASELQIRANCIFSGENSITSFGQITALLLSLAPAWSLTVAVYRWPRKQRRIQRRLRHSQDVGLSTFQSLVSNHSVVDMIVTNTDHDRGRPRGLSVGEPIVTGLLVAEPARPTVVLQSAMRGGRDRSRSQEPGAGVRPQSQGPGMRARIGHARFPTGSLMEFQLPTNTEEEWNELVTFSR